MYEISFFSDSIRQKSLHPKFNTSCSMNFSKSISLGVPSDFFQEFIYLFLPPLSKIFLQDFFQEFLQEWPIRVSMRTYSGIGRMFCLIPLKELDINGWRFFGNSCESWSPGGASGEIADATFEELSKVPVRRIKKRFVEELFQED